MAKPNQAPFRVALISTGGTIEKTYNELHGVLTNDVSVLDIMLAGLELGDMEIERVTLMNKDSLEMTEDDHQLIADTALHKTREFDGVIIVHGTDRLAVTGETIYDMDAKPRVPIILTGAMRPYELRTSDSMQNIVEALFAVQLAKRGVYVAMHNKLLAFPGVRKDVDSGTFVKD